MAALLAGLPDVVPGATINRLCGSGLDAVNLAARAIRSGEAELVIAGGVESMTRAPFVMGKADSAFSRTAKIEDTTIGWRFVNPLMKAKYGVDSMPETAENVAAEFGIARADQDAFALRSQQRYARAHAAKFLRRGDHAGRDSAEERRAASSSLPTSIRGRDDAGSAREAQRRREARRHGDGGQCIRRQRRQLRAAAGERRGGGEVSA